MASWKISYEWRLLARKITVLNGQFSSMPCLITGRQIILNHSLKEVLNIASGEEIPMSGITAVTGVYKPIYNWGGGPHCGCDFP